jgi:trans-aconitate methyltransferase
MPHKDLSRGLTFDTVADAYDRFRPRYPKEVFDAFDAGVNLSTHLSIIEVGCGTGQATEGLLERGCRVLAVEPGTELARFAREKFDPSVFDVEVATFDDWEPQGRTFDVIFSATAYHWVHPSLRWVKAAEVLNPGGFVALTTNRTLDGVSFNEFYRATHDLHAKYLRDNEETTSPTDEQLVSALQGAEADIGAVWEVAEPQGSSIVAGSLFKMPTVSWHRWNDRYTTDEVIGLLSTYSVYLSMPSEHRQELFAEMRDLVDSRFGGELVRSYLAIVAVAQKT